MKPRSYIYQRRVLGFSITWSHLGVMLVKQHPPVWGIGCMRIGTRWYQWCFAYVGSLRNYPHHTRWSWPTWGLPWR